MQSSEYANWIMTIVPSNENSLPAKGVLALSGDLAPKTGSLGIFMDRLILEYVRIILQRR